MNTNVVKLDNETYRMLKKVKEKYGVPMTQCIKRAVSVYVKNKGL